jgi:hypothetical protein
MPTCTWHQKTERRRPQKGRRRLVLLKSSGGHRMGWPRRLPDYGSVTAPEMRWVALEPTGLVAVTRT